MAGHGQFVRVSTCCGEGAQGARIFTHNAPFRRREKKFRTADKIKYELVKIKSIKMLISNNQVPSRQKQISQLQSGRTSSRSQENIETLN